MYINQKISDSLKTQTRDFSLKVSDNFSKEKFRTQTNKANQKNFFEVSNNFSKKQIKCGIKKIKRIWTSSRFNPRALIPVDTNLKGWTLKPAFNQSSGPRTFPWVALDFVQRTKTLDVEPRLRTLDESRTPN